MCVLTWESVYTWCSKSSVPMATTTINCWCRGNQWWSITDRFHPGTKNHWVSVVLTEFHEDVFALIKDHFVKVLSDQNLHWFGIPVIRDLFCV